jgi:hypothetical protein
VCAPELEAQIASDMNAVRINVNSAYSFGDIQGAQQTLERTRVVASDQKLRLDFLYSVNHDCTSMGFATVRIIEQPKHGRLTVQNGTGFTSFPQNNQRYECT